MLIVIVIIGILAAALIPRLSSARGRANDVARKADLAQVAAALVAYQIDHWKFPVCPDDNDRWCPLDDISEKLLSAGMDSVPSDINTTRENSGIDADNTLGQYAYIPIKKRWMDDNGFVIMAATETVGGSNWVAWKPWNIQNTTEFSQIVPCKTFDEGSSQNNSGDCLYNKANDELRYIYVY